MLKQEADEWCCYECVGDDEEDYTSYGKSMRLTRFVKEIANLSPERTILQLSDCAKKILKELKL